MSWDTAVGLVLALMSTPRTSLTSVRSDHIGLFPIAYLSQRDYHQAFVGPAQTLVDGIITNVQMVLTSTQCNHPLFVDTVCLPLAPTSQRHVTRLLPRSRLARATVQQGSLRLGRSVCFCLLQVSGCNHGEGSRRPVHGADSTGTVCPHQQGWQPS
jgi:hypothetical protein